MLYFTKAINPKKLKYDRLEFMNSSMSNILFTFFVVAPSILNVVKYTFLDFSIILIMKYEMKNSPKISINVTISLNILTNCTNVILSFTLKSFIDCAFIPISFNLFIVSS